MVFTFATFKILIKRWLPATVWLAFIFLMSTGTFSNDNTLSVIGPILHALFPAMNARDIDFVHVTVRKAAHVFEYFILSMLFLRGLIADKRGGWSWQLSALALVCVALAAIADEFHQSFVATRQAAVRDVIIDILGGTFAQFVAAAWCTRIAPAFRRSKTSSKIS